MKEFITGIAKGILFIAIILVVNSVFVGLGITEYGDLGTIIAICAILKHYTDKGNNNK